jgi:hypothetical protein
VEAYKDNTLLGATNPSYPLYIMQNLNFEARVLDEIPEFDSATLEKKVGHRPRVLFTWSKIRIQKDPAALQPGEDENTSVPIDDSQVKNYKISIDAGNGTNIPLMVLPPDPASSNPDRRNHYIVIRDGDSMSNPSWYKVADSDADTISFIWHDEEDAPENDLNPSITESERYPAGLRPIPGKKYAASITPNTYNDRWNSGISIYQVKNGYFYTNIKYSIIKDGYDNINIIVDKILDENIESGKYIDEPEELAKQLGVSNNGLNEIMKAGLVNLSEIDMEKISSLNMQSFQLPIEEKISLEQALNKLSDIQKEVINLLSPNLYFASFSIKSMEIAGIFLTKNDDLLLDIISPLSINFTSIS